MNILTEIGKVVPQIGNLFSLCAFIVLIIAVIITGVNKIFDTKLLATTINKLFWLALIALLPKVFVELYPYLKPDPDRTVQLDTSKIITLPGNYLGRIDVLKADTSLIQAGEYSLEISDDLVCKLINKNTFKTTVLGMIDISKKKGDKYHIPKLGEMKFRKIGLRTEFASASSFFESYNVSFSKYE